MNNSIDKLEFNIIKEKMAVYCRSSLAKEKVINLLPFSDLELLHHQQVYQEETLSLVYKYSSISLNYFEDIKESLKKIDKGGVLLPLELNNILSQLKNIKEINSYVSLNEISDLKLLDLINVLYLPKELDKIITKSIDPTGYVLDGASSELKRIRRNKATIEGDIRSKISSLKSVNSKYLHSETISTRDDHLVLPVKANYKNKVPGIVHSVSATGQTLFIEPNAIVEMNNKLLQLNNQEQEEIHRILVDITAHVSEFQESLISNQETIVELECLFAIARFSKDNDASMPVVEKQYDELVLKDARHPLIEKDKVIANDIILKKPKDIMMISGSNTGGKTIVLKTVGLLSLMALSGLPINAKEGHIPFFDQVLVDVGDNQSIEESLSTFSSHMNNVVSITNSITSKSLVILDEIGSGTDPQEGSSIAQSVIEYLHSVNCLAFVSTHYSSLKQFAKKEDYILVSAVEFDQESMQPTYRLISGSVGNSYAIEISKRLGLKQEIIDKAFSIKKDNQSDSDILLEKLQDEISNVEKEKEMLSKQIKENKSLHDRYQKDLQTINNNKEQIIEEAKDEANKLLESAKSDIDEIVKSMNSNLKQHEIIDAKRFLDEAKYASKEITNEDNHEYKVGDIVKIISANREGEVIAINKKGVLTILMGGLTLTAKVNEVIYMHEKIAVKHETSNARSLKHQTHASYELNIIGKRYEEAMLELDKFLDDALISGLNSVRIIHGMGSGVLRKGVRKMLDKNKNVESYRDGGQGEGGLGATVVKFK